MPGQNFRVKNGLEVGIGGTILISDSSGNIGIGTTNILSKLTIGGDGYFAGVVTAVSFTGIVSNSLYSTTSGIATYSSTSGIATYATTSGISTYSSTSGISTYSSTSGISTYSSTSGIATYATTSGISTYSSTSGIATYATTSGISTYSSTSGIATLSQNFIGSPDIVVSSITSSGIVTSLKFVSNVPHGTSPISVGSSTLVINLNANYLDGNTRDYYTNADNLTTGTIDKNRLSTSNSFSVQGDLYVSGNISFGGSTTQLNTTEINFRDPDIVLGIGTSFSPNDDTANHGGIAIASTEGTPLVSLNIVPGETNPYTYKKIMWFSGKSIGVGVTDAWLFNYAVGIGSTRIPNGVRLAVGGIQMTDDTVTAVSFIGNASSSTYATTSGIATYSSTSGIATYATTSGISTYSSTSGISTYSSTSGISTYSSTSGIATYATTSGIATYATGLAGTPNIVVGILTAATIYGNVVGYTTIGYVNDSISSIPIGINILNDNSLVGTSITTINFTGSAISSISSSSGISTINIQGVGGLTVDPVVSAMIF